MSRAGQDSSGWDEPALAPAPPVAYASASGMTGGASGLSSDPEEVGDGQVGTGAALAVDVSDASDTDASDSPAPALGEDEIEQRRSALESLVEMMRPAVQMDGGDLAVVSVDYENGIVEVQLQGACGSCAISSSTLKGGVERLLKERLDWVREVRGDVDDSVDPFESAAMGRGAYVPRYY
ncbi:MAG: NifU family protein [Acidimicrobiales bacterium]